MQSSPGLMTPIHPLVRAPAWLGFSSHLIPPTGWVVLAPGLCRDARHQQPNLESLLALVLGWVGLWEGQVFSGCGASSSRRVCGFSSSPHSLPAARGGLQVIGFQWVQLQAEFSLPSHRAKAKVLRSLYIRRPSGPGLALTRGSDELQLCLSHQLRCDLSV